MAEVTGKAAASFELALEIRASTRAYFSTHHLRAAMYATQDAIALEERLIPNAPIFSGRQQSYVFSSITGSVSFLEAAINEVCKDAYDGHLSYIEPLGSDCIKALAGEWVASKEGMGEILEKYNRALMLGGKESFDKGTDPYQSVANLIRLRNYVMHYKPQNINPNYVHGLQRALNKRFALNPLRNDSKDAWFPTLAFGSGCAEWSCESVRNFAAEFSRRMGIVLNYQHLGLDDKDAWLLKMEPLA